MKPLILLSLAVVSTALSFAQPADLSADRIPDSLKKNAVAVTRYENYVFELSDIDRASFKVHEITTVLHSAGESILRYNFTNSKFVKLGDFEARIYDANGKQINKFKKKDLITYNFGEGLIDDAVTNHLVVPKSSYPVTIEYIYSINYKGIQSYPRYSIALPQIAVMESSYTAIVPKELGIRFKPKNTTLEPKKSVDEKNETYSWSVKNQAAMFYEDGTVTRGKSYPHILLGPNRFKLDNYEGDLSSWKNFGVWYNKVVEGTDKISDQRMEFYRNMVKSAATNREKANIIYDYLQKNFRYVSIQLGIGGQRPLPAAFTDEKKYGDCKGLSNYVKAVLKGLGINSHLVLINRAVNDEPVDQDFPAVQFNHAILMVADKADSIWLECTSKTLPFGQLDMSTENRNAVLITENGGVLINTPVSDPMNNRFEVKSVIELDESGAGKCVSSIYGTGEFKEELMHFLDESRQDDQKAYLVRHIGYKQPDEIAIAKIADPSGYNTNITLAIEKVSEFIAGSKMFLAPHIYKFWKENMPATSKRERDYFFAMPFRKTDTTLYKLPAGFIPDMLPQGKKFECKNASFSSTFSYNEKENTIYSMTSLELKKHKISPADYSATSDFFEKVLKEEAQRIVVKKGTEGKKSF